MSLSLAPEQPPDNLIQQLTGEFRVAGIALLCKLYFKYFPFHNQHFICQAKVKSSQEKVKEKSQKKEKKDLFVFICSLV